MTRGAVYVAEGYGEAVVPVLKDLPLIKHLNLELGARYSTYSTTPGGWTYKALADWGITDWARLRGGYNLAVRAPSVGELFEGPQGKFGFTPFNPSGDPCSLQSASPYGAGHANDAQLNKALSTAGKTATLYNVGGAAGAKNTLALCLAQMGGSVAGINSAINAGGIFAAASGPSILTGADNGAFSWYNGTTVGNNAAPGSGQPGFPFQGGNQKLNAEIAKTWTAGILLNSPFKSPWLSRAAISVDWYSIIVNHTIDFGTPDASVQACYQQNVLDASGNVDPTAMTNALNTFACNYNQRNSAVGGGNWVSSLVLYTNQGYLKTRGVDATATWGADFADLGLGFIPGAINLGLLGNYLDTWQTRTDTSRPQSLLYDYAGTDYNTATLRWKLNTTLTYTVGPVSVSATWRHLPGTKSFAQRNYFTQLAAFNAGVPFVAHPPLTANPLTPATGVGLWALPAASHDEIDLSTTWSLTKNLTLRAGVNNLLDEQPEISYATSGGFDPFTAGGTWTLPTSGLAAPNAGLYDTLGRRFYFGLKADF